LKGGKGKSSWKESRKVSRVHNWTMGGRPKFVGREETEKRKGNRGPVCGVPLVRGPDERAGKYTKRPDALWKERGEELRNKNSLKTENQEKQKP